MYHSNVETVDSSQHPGEVFRLQGSDSNSSEESASTPTMPVPMPAGVARRMDSEVNEHLSLEDEFEPLALTQEQPRHLFRPVAVHSPYCGADSGYHTDSPWTVSGRSTVQDDSQHAVVFNMSMEDIPDTVGQNQTGTLTRNIHSPPGTFRPLSPAGFDHRVLRHAATQTVLAEGREAVFRPASAPIYDVADEDDDFDEEVYNNAGRFEDEATAAGYRPNLHRGPLPDLVANHDIRQRSHSVPVMEEERLRRRQSIEHVANALREIADDIDSQSPSPSPVFSLLSSTTQFRHTGSFRGQQRQTTTTTTSVRRVSVAGNTTTVVSSSSNVHVESHSMPNSTSFFQQIQSMIRTISGADIEQSHDDHPRDHSCP